MWPKWKIHLKFRFNLLETKEKAYFAPIHIFTPFGAGKIIEKMTTITPEELPESAEYLEASLRFREIWLEYLHREEEAKDEIVNMFKILVDEGYSRTKAIQKIKEDHNDLKGFSKATIYRKLPDEMKQEYSLREMKSLNQQSGQQKGQDMINKPLDVSFETYETINTTSEFETPEDAEESPLEIKEETTEPLTIDIPPPEPELQIPKY